MRRYWAYGLLFLLVFVITASVLSPSATRHQALAQTGAVTNNDDTTNHSTEVVGPDGKVQSSNLNTHGQKAITDLKDEVSQAKQTAQQAQTEANNARARASSAGNTPYQNFMIRQAQVAEQRAQEEARKARELQERLERIENTKGRVVYPCGENRTQQCSCTKGPDCDAKRDELPTGANASAEPASAPSTLDAIREGFKRGVQTALSPFVRPALSEGPLDAIFGTGEEPTLLADTTPGVDALATEPTVDAPPVLGDGTPVDSGGFDINELYGPPPPPDTSAQPTDTPGPIASLTPEEGGALQRFFQMPVAFPGEPITRQDFANIDASAGLDSTIDTIPGISIDDGTFAGALPEVSMPQSPVAETATGAPQGALAGWRNMQGGFCRGTGLCASPDVPGLVVDNAPPADAFSQNPAVLTPANPALRLGCLVTGSCSQATSNFDLPEVGASTAIEPIGEFGPGPQTEMIAGPPARGVAEVQRNLDAVNQAIETRRAEIDASFDPSNPLANFNSETGIVDPEIADLTTQRDAYLQEIQQKQDALFTSTRAQRPQTPEVQAQIDAVADRISAQLSATDESIAGLQARRADIVRQLNDQVPFGQLPSEEALNSPVNRALRTELADVNQQIARLEESRTPQLATVDYLRTGEHPDQLLRTLSSDANPADRVIQEFAQQDVVNRYDAKQAVENDSNSGRDFGARFEAWWSGAEEQLQTTDSNLAQLFGAEPASAQLQETVRRATGELTPMEQFIDGTVMVTDSWWSKDLSDYTTPQGILVNGAGFLGDAIYQGGLNAFGAESTAQLLAERTLTPSAQSALYFVDAAFVVPDATDVSRIGRYAATYGARTATRNFGNIRSIVNATLAPQRAPVVSDVPNFSNNPVVSSAPSVPSIPRASTPVVAQAPRVDAVVTPSAPVVSTSDVVPSSAVTAPVVAPNSVLTPVTPRTTVTPSSPSVSVAEPVSATRMVTVQPTVSALPVQAPRFGGTVIPNLAEGVINTGFSAVPAISGLSRAVNAAISPNTGIPAILTGARSTPPSVSTVAPSLNNVLPFSIPSLSPSGPSPSNVPITAGVPRAQPVSAPNTGLGQGGMLSTLAPNETVRNLGIGALQLMRVAGFEPSGALRATGQSLGQPAITRSISGDEVASVGPQPTGNRITGTGLPPTLARLVDPVNDLEPLSRSGVGSGGAVSAPADLGRGGNTFVENQSPLARETFSETANTSPTIFERIGRAFSEYRADRNPTFGTVPANLYGSGYRVRILDAQPLGQGAEGSVWAVRGEVVGDGSSRWRDGEIVDVAYKEFFSTRLFGESLDAHWTATQDGLRVPELYAPVNIGKTDGRLGVLLPNYNSGGRVALPFNTTSANSVNHGFRLDGVSNFDTFLDDYFNEAIVASRALDNRGTFINPETPFFIAPASGGVGALDFAMVDLGRVSSFQQGARGYENVLPVNVENLRQALTSYLDSHISNSAEAQRLIAQANARADAILQEGLANAPASVRPVVQRPSSVVQQPAGSAPFSTGLPRTAGINEPVFAPETGSSLGGGGGVASAPADVGRGGSATAQTNRALQIDAPDNIRGEVTARLVDGDGNTLATADLRIGAGRQPYIEFHNLRVPPTVQGRGYGSEMVQEVNRIIERSGVPGHLVDRIDSNRNPLAVGLYERAGWTPVEGTRGHFVYDPANVFTDDVVADMVRGTDLGGVTTLRWGTEPGTGRFALGGPDRIPASGVTTDVAESVPVVRTADVGENVQPSVASAGTEETPTLRDRVGSAVRVFFNVNPNAGASSNLGLQFENAYRAFLEPEGFSSGRGGVASAPADVGRGGSATAQGFDVTAGAPGDTRPLFWRQERVDATTDALQRFVEERGYSLTVTKPVAQHSLTTVVRPSDDLITEAEFGSSSTIFSQPWLTNLPKPAFLEESFENARRFTQAQGQLENALRQANIWSARPRITDTASTAQRDAVRRSLDEVSRTDTTLQDIRDLYESNAYRTNNLEALRGSIEAVATAFRRVDSVHSDPLADITRALRIPPGRDAWDSLTLAEKTQMLDRADAVADIFRAFVQNPNVLGPRIPEVIAQIQPSPFTRGRLLIEPPEKVAQVDTIINATRFLNEVEVPSTINAGEYKQRISDVQELARVAREDIVALASSNVPLGTRSRASFTSDFDWRPDSSVRITEENGSLFATFDESVSISRVPEGSAITRGNEVLTTARGDVIQVPAGTTWELPQNARLVSEDPFTSEVRFELPLSSGDSVLLPEGVVVRFPAQSEFDIPALATLNRAPDSTLRARAEESAEELVDALYALDDAVPGYVNDALARATRLAEEEVVDTTIVPGRSGSGVAFGDTTPQIGLGPERGPVFAPPDDIPRGGNGVASAPADLGRGGGVPNTARAWTTESVVPQGGGVRTTERLAGEASIIYDLDGDTMNVVFIVSEDGNNAVLSTISRRLADIASVGDVSRVTFSTVPESLSFLPQERLNRVYSRLPGVSFEDLPDGTRTFSISADDFVRAVDSRFPPATPRVASASTQQTLQTPITSAGVPRVAGGRADITASPADIGRGSVTPQAPLNDVADDLGGTTPAFLTRDTSGDIVDSTIDDIPTWREAIDTAVTNAIGAIGRAFRPVSDVVLGPASRNPLDSGTSRVGEGPRGVDFADDSFTEAVVDVSTLPAVDIARFAPDGALQNPNAVQVADDFFDEGVTGGTLAERLRDVDTGSRGPLDGPTSEALARLQARLDDARSAGTADTPSGVVLDDLDPLPSAFINDSLRSILSRADSTPVPRESTDDFFDALPTPGSGVRNADDIFVDPRVASFAPSAPRGLTDVTPVNARATRESYNANELFEPGGPLADVTTVPIVRFENGAMGFRHPETGNVYVASVPRSDGFIEPIPNIKNPLEDAPMFAEYEPLGPVRSTLARVSPLFGRELPYEVTSAVAVTDARRVIAGAIDDPEIIELITPPPSSIDAVPGEEFVDIPFVEPTFREVFADVRRNLTDDVRSLGQAITRPFGRTADPVVTNTDDVAVAMPFVAPRSDVADVVTPPVIADDVIDPGPPLSQERSTQLGALERIDAQNADIGGQLDSIEADLAGVRADFDAVPSVGPLTERSVPRPVAPRAFADSVRELGQNLRDLRFARGVEALRQLPEPQATGVTPPPPVNMANVDVRLADALEAGAPRQADFNPITAPNDPSTVDDVLELGDSVPNTALNDRLAQLPDNAQITDDIIPNAGGEIPSLEPIIFRADTFGAETTDLLAVNELVASGRPIGNELARLRNALDARRTEAVPPVAPSDGASADPRVLQEILTDTSPDPSFGEGLLSGNFGQSIPLARPAFVDTAVTFARRVRNVVGDIFGNPTGVGSIVDDGVRADTRVISDLLSDSSITTFGDEILPVARPVTSIDPARTLDPEVVARARALDDSFRSRDANVLPGQVAPAEIVDAGTPQTARRPLVAIDENGRPIIPSTNEQAVLALRDALEVNHRLREFVTPNEPFAGRVDPARLVDPEVVARVRALDDAYAERLEQLREVEDLGARLNAWQRARDIGRAYADEIVPATMGSQSVVGDVPTIPEVDLDAVADLRAQLPTAPEQRQPTFAERVSDWYEGWAERVLLSDEGVPTPRQSDPVVSVTDNGRPITPARDQGAINALEDRLQRRTIGQTLEGGRARQVESLRQRLQDVQARRTAIIEPQPGPRGPDSQVPRGTRTLDDASTLRLADEDVRPRTADEGVDALVRGTNDGDLPRFVRSEPDGSASDPEIRASGEEADARSRRFARNVLILTPFAGLAGFLATTLDFSPSESVPPQDNDSVETATFAVRECTTIDCAGNERDRLQRLVDATTGADRRQAEALLEQAQEQLDDFLVERRVEPGDTRDVDIDDGKTRIAEELRIAEEARLAQESAEARIAELRQKGAGERTAEEDRAFIDAIEERDTAIQMQERARERINAITIGDEVPESPIVTSDDDSAVTAKRVTPRRDDVTVVTETRVATPRRDDVPDTDGSVAGGVTPRASEVSGGSATPSPAPVSSGGIGGLGGGGGAPGGGALSGITSGMLGGLNEVFKNMFGRLFNTEGQPKEDQQTAQNDGDADSDIAVHRPQVDSFICLPLEEENMITLIWACNDATTQSFGTGFDTQGAVRRDEPLDVELVGGRKLEDVRIRCADNRGRTSEEVRCNQTQTQAPTNTPGALDFDLFFGTPSQVGGFGSGFTDPLNANTAEDTYLEGYVE